MIRALYFLEVKQESTNELLMALDFRSNLQPQAGSGGSSGWKRNFRDQIKKTKKVEKLS